MSDVAAADYRGIWVIAEQQDGRIGATGAMLLGVARTLADSSGEFLTSLRVGGTGEVGDGSGAADEAIDYGADSALRVGDEPLAGRAASACAAVAALAATRRPAVIMLADSPAARDLAPRLARRLGTGLISAADPGSLDLDPASGSLLVTRREWSGRLLTTYALPNSRPAIVTVCVGDGRRETGDGGQASASGQFGTQTSKLKTQTSKLNPRSLSPVSRLLAAARCVVVGGSGVGSAEGFARVRRLAEALGGEWGATEGAVEAGWAPPEREIGLYGTTVRPDLYIGCGVSGSPQHVVGMQQARTVIAINTDPAAPIFRWANYAVVADSNELIDRLLERLGADR